MRWGLALLRVVVGAGFMAHGAQKLFGWFGGYGLEGTGKFFEENLQLAPGKRNAAAAGLSEFGGGALVAAGAAMPVATATLTGTMTTAVWTVHKEKGFFASDGGYELNLVLVAALAALTDAGPGALSLGRSDGHGSFVTLLALAAGAAGGFAAMELGRREYEKQSAGQGAPAASASA
ncbi:MAG: DoxX family protein [Solirubrobacterales bacterium]